MLKKVSGDQVRDAMTAAGIDSVYRQDCGACGAQMSYTRQGDQLFYNSGCDLQGVHSHSDPHLFSWQDAADWINKPRTIEERREIAAKFGLTLDDEGGVPP